MNTPRNIFRYCFVLCLWIGVCAGKPSIEGSGIRNSASLHGPAMRSGAIAKGSIFTVFGSGIGPVSGVSHSSYPLISSLGGVQVLIEQQGGLRACPLLFVQAQQVNAIMPIDVAAGAAKVYIEFQGERSNVEPINIVSNQPGLFSWNGTGLDGGAITDAAFSPIWAARPATPGQVVILWATGLGGGQSGDDLNPRAFELNAGLSVLVGNTRVPVLHKFRSGCCVGLDQIAIELPKDVEDCAVPVRIRNADGVDSNVVTIAIASTSSCSLEGGLTVVQDSNGRSISIGTVLAQRAGAGSAVEDLIAVVFQKFEGLSAVGFSSLSRFPISGNCAIYSTEALVGNFPVTRSGVNIDAGPAVDLKVQSRTLSMRRSLRNVYGSSNLASGFNFYDGSTVTVVSPGAAELPALSLELPSPKGSPFDLPDQVSKGQDLVLRWNRSIDNPGKAVFWLVASGRTNVGAIDVPFSVDLLCSEKYSSGEMLIPKEILSQIPDGVAETVAVSGFEKSTIIVERDAKVPAMGFSRRVWTKSIRLR